MFVADNAVTVGFVPICSNVRPAAAVATAKTRAARRDRSPRTSGRFFVRDICASYLGSNIMLSVLALHEERKVPMVRYRKVRVDVERVGSGAMEGSMVKRDDIGYMPYAEVVVRTIRTERRGFVRAR